MCAFRFDMGNCHAAQIDARHSADDPLYDERVNVVGEVDLLRASVGVGVRASVFASSGGAIYGEQTDVASERIA